MRGAVACSIPTSSEETRSSGATTRRATTSATWSPSRGGRRPTSCRSTLSRSRGCGVRADDGGHPEPPQGQHDQRLHTPRPAGSRDLARMGADRGLRLRAVLQAGDERGGPGRGGSLDARADRRRDGAGRRVLPSVSDPGDGRAVPRGLPERRRLLRAEEAARSDRQVPQQALGRLLRARSRSSAGCPSRPAPRPADPAALSRGSRSGAACRRGSTLRERVQARRGADAT